MSASLLTNPANGAQPEAEARGAMDFSATSPAKARLRAGVQNKRRPELDAGSSPAEAGLSGEVS